MGVLDAAVHALPAGGTIEVRCVAGEHHPSLPERAANTPMDAEDAGPNSLVGNRAEHARDPAVEFVLRDLLVFSCLGLDRDDAPQPVAKVQGKRGAVGRSDARPREVALDPHVCQRNTSVVGLAFKMQTELLAYRAASAVAADQVVGLDVYGAVGRGDARFDAVGGLRPLQEFVVEAQVA